MGLTLGAGPAYDPPRGATLWTAVSWPVGLWTARSQELVEALVPDEPPEEDELLPDDPLPEVDDEPPSPEEVFEAFSPPLEEEPESFAPSDPLGLLDPFDPEEPSGARESLR